MSHVCKENCCTPPICSPDILVLAAINESYLNLTVDQVDQVTNLIFNPQTGLWTTYKNSGCKTCDNILNAKIFSQIIPLSVHLFLLTTPDDSDTSAADISYAAVQLLVNLYVHFPCICSGDPKKRCQIQEVFLSSFTQLNISAIETVIVDEGEIQIVDAIFVQATVRNTFAFLCIPGLPEIAKISPG